MLLNYIPHVRNLKRWKKQNISHLYPNSSKNSIVIGNVGGLSLFWEKGTDLEVCYLFLFLILIQMLIVCLVYSEPASKVWMLLHVYVPS